MAEDSQKVCKIIIYGKINDFSWFTDFSLLYITLYS